jgi:Zn-dependent protease
MFGSSKVIFEFRGVFGVPVHIGSSILLLVFLFLSFGTGTAQLLYNTIFLGMIIGSIYLHELGHAWATLVQGIPVRRIMIYGGGGFCERTRSATPRQEELIVAMGPIVNLSIWAVASLIWPYMPEGLLMWAVNLLAWINLFLAIFNMIPVQPLDGGKLFQLLLLRFTSQAMAMRIAGGVGLVISVLWIPAMYLAYTRLGFLLFFFPPISLHWQMLRRKL